MTTQDIIDVINALPVYIQYIYPGYLMIYLYLFFRGRYMRNNGYTVMLSIAFSYMQIEFLKGVRSFKSIDYICSFLLNHGWYGYGKSLALLVLSVIVAWIAYTITQSEWIGPVLKFFGVYTGFQGNELEALVKPREGAWLVVYLKDCNIVYEGSITGHEMDAEDGNKYIRLSKYQKYTIDANGNASPYLENYEHNKNKITTIHYDQIARIEKR